ncbi:MAG TPA: tetratricopeptide repeat protein, partial [Nitrospiria bacterium]|nr:tetratricopeptide repeat protein [Nitrospiria bacterium]
MNRKIFWMMWTICLTAMLATMAGCGGVEARKAKYTALAHQYIDEGNWPKARVALRNLLKIDPKSADGYFLYGQVEEKEKNWINAFRNYLKVVELNPDHYDALTRLGKFYLEGGEPDKAEETADRILATHPGDAEADTLKAGVLAKQGHPAEAIAKAEAVHQRHPDNPDAAIMLAALYAQQHRPQESETVLRRTLQANPDNTALLISLGNSLVQAGKPDEAEKVFQHLIE